MENNFSPQIPLSMILDTCNNSFKFFMQSVVGMQNPDFLNELDDILSDPIYKKIVAAYPRGHGKSTHLSIGYPAWRIAQNHNLRILIVSNTASVAQGMLRGILNQVEENEKYKEFSKYIDPLGIGIRPKMSRQSKMEEKWSSNAVTVDRDDVSLKDPSIQALGLFGSIISKRADIIIADDIVDQKNSETEDQREKIKDWFYTTLLPILVPGGQVIYLGNTWHANDLVSDLLNDPQFIYRRKLKTIISESNDIEDWRKWAEIRLDQDLEPKQRIVLSESFYTDNKEKMDDGIKMLWPDRYTYGDMYLERLANSYAFARMRQCDPSDRPNQRVKEDWLLKAKEKGKGLKMQDMERENLTMDLTTSGLDLAISLKESADDTVLLTLDRVRYGNDILKTGDFVIRNIKRGKMTPNDVRVMVKTHNDFVKPHGIRVESVAYQESMVRDLWDMGIVNVRGHKTGGEKNDIEIGINSIAILLENGKLVIPYDNSDPRTIDLANQLINELRSWPEGHTGDSLMALWFAVLETRDFAAKRIIIPIQETSKPIASDADLSKVLLDIDMKLVKESNDERQKGKQQVGGKFVF